MISPSHRAAIEAQVVGAASRRHPDVMRACIVTAWACLGYPRAEVEAIVYKEGEQHDTRADRSV